MPESPPYKLHKLSWHAGILFLIDVGLTERENTLKAENGNVQSEW